jgi:hypothetical protein
MRPSVGPHVIGRRRNEGTRLLSCAVLRTLGNRRRRGHRGKGDGRRKSKDRFDRHGCVFWLAGGTPLTQWPGKPGHCVARAIEGAERMRSVVVLVPGRIGSEPTADDRIRIGARITAAHVDIEPGVAAMGPAVAPPANGRRRNGGPRLLDGAVLRRRSSTRRSGRGGKRNGGRKSKDRFHQHGGCLLVRGIPMVACQSGPTCRSIHRCPPSGHDHVPLCIYRDFMPLEVTTGHGQARTAATAPLDSGASPILSQAAIDV